MLDVNYIRLLRAILNKSWKQHHLKKLQLGHFSKKNKKKHPSNLNKTYERLQENQGQMFF